MVLHGRFSPLEKGFKTGKEKEKSPSVQGQKGESKARGKAGSAVRARFWPSALQKKKKKKTVS